VILGVVEGDEKGSLKSERVKYGLEYQTNRIRQRMCWQRPAAYTKDRPVFSSERAPHKKKTVTAKQQSTSGNESQLGLDTKTD
jgi:hypothetical protein